MSDYRQEWFSCGSMGRLIGVAPNTILAWSKGKDSTNKLPAFHKLPGSGEVRFHRADIEVYLREHNLPKLDRLILRQRTGI